MTHEARGSFEIDIQPATDEGPLARSLLTKTFSGDLKGTSVGQMLAFTTEVKGSAGYVAMEQVSATLAGHAGTFVLQHHGIMDQGKPQLQVTVIPDSGTDGLVGLKGEMTIEIEAGAHHYRFRYDFHD